MKTTTITAAAIVTALFIICSVVQTAQAQIQTDYNKLVNLFRQFEDRCVNLDGFTKEQCDLIWDCVVVDKHSVKECEDKANKK